MMKADIKYQNHLELMLRCNRDSQTVCEHQYTTYPLRLSPIFRLEDGNENVNCDRQAWAKPNRAYLYMINTSPGLLAGDELNLSLALAAHTSLYLTDQAATKVHPVAESKTWSKPGTAMKATVNYQIVVHANASLELVPEPIILYRDSVLEQNIQIELHSTAKLFLSEIILPGRLARAEYYEFNYYFNRLQIKDLTGKLLFMDAMRLVGKNNPFTNNKQNNKMFASLPIMGNAIAILPGVDLELLTPFLENVKLANCKNIEVATTILPNTNGILIRALASKTEELKKYFTYALNCIRKITNQSILPYIPK